MNLPNVKKPCSQCPFRKDSLPGWLGEKRAAEIAASSAFTCHKTNKPRLQCAGHMLMLGNKNDFVRLARRLGAPVVLTGRELVFESSELFIKHHS